MNRLSKIKQIPKNYDIVTKNLNLFQPNIKKNMYSTKYLSPIYSKSNSNFVYANGKVKLIKEQKIKTTNDSFHQLELIGHKSQISKQQAGYQEIIKNARINKMKSKNWNEIGNQAKFTYF